MSLFTHTYTQRLYLYCIFHGIIMKYSHFAEEISGPVNVSMCKYIYKLVLTFKGLPLIALT